MKSVENKILSEEQIIGKLESWCAYRERCDSEVRQKLYLLKVEEKETDHYLNYLREHNFLNEERFIAAFARGKFNIKNWGKRKIIDELKKKRIEEKKILAVIAEIDEGMYFIRLQDVLEKKLRLIREADAFKQRLKLIRFALQKGYEPELIYEALKTIGV